MERKSVTTTRELLPAHHLLLGLAAGDRIGGPTRMAVVLAESLANCQVFDLENIALRYVTWWKVEGFDTGPTANRAFALLNQGVPLNRASREVDKAMNGMTAGCNAAHRCAPLALCHFIPDDDPSDSAAQRHSDDVSLSDAARAEARITHYHPLAADTAVAMVRLCRALLTGKEWPLARSIAAAGRLPETVAALSPTSEATLSSSGFAPDALEAAIWFIEQSNNLEEALEHSIAFAGGSNYCPVLVGSIGGAYWGCNELSPSWYQHHGEWLERIEQIAPEFNQ